MNRLQRLLELRAAAARALAAAGLSAPATTLACPPIEPGERLGSYWLVLEATRAGDAASDAVLSGRCVREAGLAARDACYALVVAVGELADEGLRALEGRAA